MKKMILGCLLSTISTLASAQSAIGVSLATSRNDHHMETVWYHQQVAKRFSVGLQFRNSDVRYRFVDAQAIERGNTLFAGLTLGYAIKTEENYRLDFNLTTSYRRLENEESEALSQVTDGLEIDPTLLFSLRANSSLIYHTGALFRAATQLGPTAVSDEQLPSAIVLNGLSYSFGPSSLTLRTYAGPMNGASGDTGKFFWQVSLGYQYTFSGRFASALPFINF